MVLDLNMPDMHGLDVLKFVRSHPSLGRLPVLVLTTRGDESSRDAAMAAGATDVYDQAVRPAGARRARAPPARGERAGICRGGSPCRAAESTSDEFLAEFLDDYFAESDEHLTAVRRILLELEPSLAPPASLAMLEELFRSFHSLKGLAGMVDLRQAELLSHHLESYLRRLRMPTASSAAAGVDALIAGTDLLEQVLAARRLGQAPPSIDGVDGRGCGARRGTGRSSRRCRRRLRRRRSGSSASRRRRTWSRAALPSIASVRGFASSGEIIRDAAGSMRTAASRSSSWSPGDWKPEDEIWRDQGVTIEPVAPPAGQVRPATHGSAPAGRSALWRRRRRISSASTWRGSTS